MEDQLLENQNPPAPEAEPADPVFDRLLRERDEALREAETLRAALEDSRLAQYLTARGVDPASAGETAALLSARVTESVSFEAAAEQYLREQAARPAPLRVDLTAPVGGGGHSPTAGETMNRILREAHRR